jgi:hypothetical protein
MDSQKRLARTAGLRKVAVALAILFIVQVFTAAVGNVLVQSFIDGGPSGNSLTLGVSLMMFSSIVIVAIGVLLYQVLKTANKRLAASILIIRITECVVALSFGVYLLTQLQAVPNHLLWVYIFAGTAGVILCYLLFTRKMVPRSIAVLGLVGYSLLLLGVPLDFAGAIDMNVGLGQGFIVPGALFEVIVLPAWLIAKGFSSVDGGRRKGMVRSPVTTA